MVKIVVGQWEERVIIGTSNNRDRHYYIRQMRQSNIMPEHAVYCKGSQVV